MAGARVLSRAMPGLVLLYPKPYVASASGIVANFLSRLPIARPPLYRLPLRSSANSFLAGTSLGLNLQPLESVAQISRGVAYVFPAIERSGLWSRQQVRCSGSLKAKGKPRGPLWRQRKGVSKEALQVVFELKRCKGDRQKERNVSVSSKGSCTCVRYVNMESEKLVLQTSAARLLKMDLLMVLVELRRQDECALAKQIFSMVRKEEWYKPDIYLYREMMDTLGKNKLIEDVEQLMREMQDEGISVDAMILTEFLGAYIRCGNVPRAYEVYEEIKEGGLQPEYIMYEIMCRGLKKSGDFEKLKVVMEDCEKDFPDNPPPFSRMVMETGR